MIEAGIDQPGFGVGAGLTAARAEVEEVPAFLGGTEDERRGQEDRLLDGTLGQGGIVAVAQHQCLGMQAVITNAILLVT